MSYKVRPFWKAGFGWSFKGGITSYEIEGRKLVINKILGEPATFDLSGPPAPTFIPTQKGLQKIFNLGNVTVSIGTEKVVCRNIRRLSQFITALDGSHPAVQDTLKNAKTPWYANASIEDLEKFNVEIPSPPDACGIPLYYHYRNYDVLSHYQVGEWVSKGDKLLSFTKSGRTISSIISPVDGKISENNVSKQKSQMFSFNHWDRGSKDISEYNNTHNAKTLFSIRPVMGQFNESSFVPEAFKPLKNLILAHQDSHPDHKKQIERALLAMDSIAPIVRPI